MINTEHALYQSFMTEYKETMKFLSDKPDLMERRGTQIGLAVRHARMNQFGLGINLLKIMREA